LAKVIDSLPGVRDAYDAYADRRGGEMSRGMMSYDHTNVTARLPGTSGTGERMAMLMSRIRANLQYSQQCLSDQPRMPRPHRYS